MPYKMKVKNYKVPMASLKPMWCAQSETRCRKRVPYNGETMKKTPNSQRQFREVSPTALESLRRPLRFLDALV